MKIAFTDGYFAQISYEFENKYRPIIRICKPDKYLLHR